MATPSGRRSIQIVRAVQGALVACCAATPVLAQQAQPAAAEPGTLTEVVVTGSRIQQNIAQSTQPLSVISSADIEKTGVATVGDLLQQLTTGGAALNPKFNSSGNFGYPPDGGGIGAGSEQVDLRNLDSKRTLVLVDGLRWVNESSASGVSGSADLSTIPIEIIDRIEVLEDGASSIYGSDAIAGVVNIITKKKVNGVELTGYEGTYNKGGQTTQASLTAGGSSGKFSGVFVASFYNQQEISSSKWWASSLPEPRAGIGSGSSGTAQGRDIFCDPSIAAGPDPNNPTYGSCANPFDVTLNSGTVPPNPPSSANATGPGYHNFSNADRFNFAPLNLLLTPSQRKSLWTSVNYDINDDVQMYAKGLFNNRTSVNQAAPEPIFLGPFAGTGGIADGINISHLNPFNPFGIDLCATPSANCGNGTQNSFFITRRPIEGGPRIFTQDVDTWYFSAGFKGTLHVMDGLNWDLNFIDTDNKANQKFTGGYNLSHLSLALGDPAICALVPNCTPLDLFGGQSRPITPAMLNYVEATQLDSSDQQLKVISGNITGTIFHIEDRAAGLAIGAEHRVYVGIFDPDPLRQTGESQDSLAFPVNQSYHVDEGYAELSLPLLSTLGASAAVRYSDYSTFGNKTTYKGGLRWQPVHDFGVRGDYSTGFRAPNLGELYGLTQFGATLVDPCGPTGGGVAPQYVAGCAAQHVPAGFQQANTQITTFTGGNASLKPETSDSYTVGLVYNASWAEGHAATAKLNGEVTYYNVKVKGAIQAEDIQALLNACLSTGGGTDPALCAPFSRGAGSQLNPPHNFLENLAQITTSGEDIKINWASEALSFGHLTAALQATHVSTYKAVDTLGLVSQRAVGIEVNNSAIPDWRINAQLGWAFGPIDVSWNVRYLSSVKESCGNAATTIPVPGCTDSAGNFNANAFNTLDATVYNDVQIAWNDAFRMTGLRFELGGTNVFGVNPPICYTCTLNGYDAGTYDLPGPFYYARAAYKF